MNRKSIHRFKEISHCQDCQAGLIAVFTALGIGHKLAVLSQITKEILGILKIYIKLAKDGLLGFGRGRQNRL